MRGSDPTSKNVTPRVGRGAKRGATRTHIPKNSAQFYKNGSLEFFLIINAHKQTQQIYIMYIGMYDITINSLTSRIRYILPAPAGKFLQIRKELLSSQQLPQHKYNSRYEGRNRKSL